MISDCARNVDSVFQTLFPVVAAILRKWVGYEMSGT